MSWPPYLNSGAHGHGLVGVDGLGGGLAENRLHRGLHLRHTRHAADQNDVIDFAFGEFGVLDGLITGLDGAGNQFVNDSLELSPGDFQVQMFWSGRVHGEEGHVDVGLGGAGKFDFRVFRSFFDTLGSLTCGDF